LNNQDTWPIALAKLVCNRHHIINAHFYYEFSRVVNHVFFLKYNHSTFAFFSRAHRRGQSVKKSEVISQALSLSFLNAKSSESNNRHDQVATKWASVIHPSSYNRFTTSVKALFANAFMS
jgi:hypothetical protein